ncbi:MAG: hypothetical protein J7647_05560 [Cyanobacteria bacterium SBLK]|nr:hypothetical protein [Cyanobacteria bacterium SBLK]
MTSPKTPIIDFLEETFDLEWQEEALRIEEECGDFAIGRFGNNYGYFRNSLTGNPALADRIEELQALLREELEADEAILDSKAFGNQHFQHPTPEILDILAIALEYKDKEAQRKKIRNAIAVAWSYSY